MVHVVFAEVVLRQVRDVRLLDMWNIERLKHPDVHFVFVVSLAVDVLET